MYNITFAQRMQLLPADVVITPKSIFNIIEHYVIYLGVNQYGQEIYIENDYKNGVQLITGETFCFKNSVAKRVRRFEGDETQRYWAVERAKSLLTSKYDLANFNCENFANFVQLGTSFSTQVNAAKSALLLTAIFGAVVAIDRSLRQSSS